MKPIEINSMHGLGDNIFIRPFVRAQAAIRPVFLATPWPELFEDIPNIKFQYHISRLRTQAKNLARQATKNREWAGTLPFDTPRVQLGYGDVELRAMGSITKVIERKLPLNGFPYKLDLPRSMHARFKTPTALIRPVTTRKEWTNTARSPRPEYVYQIAERLMATHDVVLVADLKDKEEWIEGELPPHHRAYLRGELSVEALLRFVAEASVVVGGVGWIVPAAIAAGTPAFVINGGQALHNKKSVVTDPRMDLSKIYFAEPDNFCHCNQMRHASCDKTIKDLDAHWTNFGSLLARATQ
jgi:hypothetical protein